MTGKPNCQSRFVEGLITGWVKTSGGGSYRNVEIEISVKSDSIIFYLDRYTDEFNHCILRIPKGVIRLEEEVTTTQKNLFSEMLS